MKTNILLKFTAAVCLTVLSTVLRAAEPTLQDFLTPAQDGAKAPAKPRQPDKIKKSKKQLTKDGDKTTVVEGANIQDAAAAAVMELEEEEDDVAVFKAPGGGIGVMARGTAFYRTFKNRNASLISKRLAYVQAYLQAKGHLAQYTHGLNVNARQDLVNAIDQYDNANNSLGNSAVVFNETNKQKVEGLLRGYVLYEVKDDVKEQEVSVTIATTPVTRGATMRATPSVIVADDLAAGMEQVLVELNNAVIPPICGRVVSVANKKGDQDLYFVGFGSAIIPINRNKTVQKRLGQAAKRQAQMRATASLVGLIMGDQMAWSSGLTSQTLDQQKQFDLKGDPMKDGEESVIPVGGTYDVFRSRVQATDAFRSAQKGKLPAGIDTKTWKSKDGDWYFAAYVYNPKMTLVAQGKVDIRKKPKKPIQGEPLPKKPKGGPTGIIQLPHGDAAAHCPADTPRLKVITRRVETYGHAKQAAILRGLVEAVQQVNGLSLNSAQQMESSIKQLIKETNKDSKEEVEIQDLTKEQIRTASKGFVAGYKILEAKLEKKEWKVSLEVCVYRYLSPSNKKGLPTLVVAPFRFAKPHFDIGPAQAPKPLDANQVATRLSGNLANKLFKAGQYNVLNRRWDLEVKKEKAFVFENASIKELVRFGAAKGADYILAGAINDFSQVDIPFFVELLDQRGVNSFGSVAVDFQVIEVGTREVIWGDNFAFPLGKAELNRLLPHQRQQRMHDATADVMVNGFLDALHPIKVMKVPDATGRVLLNQGLGRVKVGDTFSLHSPGATYVDPASGLKKNASGPAIGVMHIVQVDAGAAWGRIIEGDAAGVKYGSLCKRAQLLPPAKGPVDDGTPGIK